MPQIRALIVDDSSVMRKIVERCLRQAGLDLSDVQQASNGVEALAILNQSDFDLILSDINMPLMDGLEFVRTIRTLEKAKDIPVVMITTEGGEQHVWKRCLWEPRDTSASHLRPNKSKNTLSRYYGARS